MPTHFATRFRAAMAAMGRHDREFVAAMATPAPQAILAVRRALDRIRFQDVSTGNPVLLLLEKSRLFWVSSYYAAECGTQAHRAELGAAIAYLLGGRSAFDKIRDPFGHGHLILEKRANELVIRSHLDASPLVGSATAKMEASLTVPMH